VHLVQNDPHSAGRSIGQMRAQARIHALIINPVIYAEVSLSFSTVEALDKVIGGARDSARSVLPGGQGLRPISTARRPAPAGAAALLHRCA
jgi:hypothetical protein